MNPECFLPAGGPALGVQPVGICTTALTLSPSISPPSFPPLLSLVFLPGAYNLRNTGEIKGTFYFLEA